MAVQLGVLMIDFYEVAVVVEGKLQKSKKAMFLFSGRPFPPVSVVMI